jgi:hypothetical protein
MIISKSMTLNVLSLIIALAPFIISSCAEKDENIKPEVQSANFSTKRNDSFTGHLDARDRDGEVFEFKVVVLPIRGSISIDTRTGVFVYTPQADYTGTDAFQVVVVDDNGTSSDPAIVRIVISSIATG